MPREPRIRKLLGRHKAEIIADVPASIDACEACRVVDCTQERWLACPERLAVETERKRQAQEAASREAAARAAVHPAVKADPGGKRLWMLRAKKP